MKARMRLVLALSLLAPAQALAQKTPAGPVPAGSGAPIEITAGQTLEWHRNEKQYVAVGDVVVTQGGVSIKADRLTADYRETGKSGMEIYRLTAEGHVRIASQGNTAEGDRAVYDVDSGMATMTGQALRLSSPEQVVTATDRFEYRVADGRLLAVGHARAVRGEDTVTADTLSAVFHDDPATKKRALSTLEADRNVVITTPTETLKGDKGAYDAATDVARLDGHVIITRGLNRLEGERAEVNLTTDVSSLTGAGDNGRVRGVFFPGSENVRDKKPADKQDDKPVPEQPDTKGPSGT